MKEVVADLHQTQEDKELLKKQDDNVIQKLLDLNMNLGRRRILIADAPEDVKKQHRELEEQVEFAEYRNKIREGDPNAEELKAILKSYNQPLP